MRNFTKIVAWQRSDDLAVLIYNATRSFPREEQYGLISQVRRSAASVAANIAEGAARNTSRDYLHFLYIARGSLAETQYFVHLAQRLTYLNAKDAEALKTQVNSTFAALHGLIQTVEKDCGRLARVVAGVSSLLVVAVGRSFVSSV